MKKENPLGLSHQRKCGQNMLGIETLKPSRLFQKIPGNNCGTSKIGVEILCFMDEKQDRIEEHFEYVDQNLCAPHQGFVGQHEYL